MVYVWTDSHSLTDCYHKGEQDWYTLYCNGTAITWSKTPFGSVDALNRHNISPGQYNSDRWFEICFPERALDHAEDWLRQCLSSKDNAVAEWDRQIAQCEVKIRRIKDRQGVSK
jgi:hypothetical protein